LGVLKQGKRGFVEKIDFVTSLGYGKGGDDRASYGVTTKGPSRLSTNLCIMEPHSTDKDFIVTSIHPGISRGDMIATNGWQVEFVDEIAQTPVPSDHELQILRDLHTCTNAAHEGQ
jgi:glutaconate CoA-transferase subunit B